MNFLQELLFRLKSKSPDFFKRLQVLSGVVLALSAAGLWLISNDVWVPAYAAKLTTVLTALSGVASGIFFGTALPVTPDKADTIQEKKAEKAITDASTDKK